MNVAVELHDVPTFSIRTIAPGELERVLVSADIDEDTLRRWRHVASLQAAVQAELADVWNSAVRASADLPGYPARRPGRPPGGKRRAARLP